MDIGHRFGHIRFSQYVWFAPYVASNGWGHAFLPTITLILNGGLLTDDLKPKKFPIVIFIIIAMVIIISRSDNLHMRAIIWIYWLLMHKISKSDE